MCVQHKSHLLWGSQGDDITRRGWGGYVCVSSTSHMYCGVARVIILQGGGWGGRSVDTYTHTHGSEDNLLTDDENSTKQEKLCF